MQRTGTLRTVFLAFFVIGSLVFVCRYLGVIGPTPPVSVPSPQPISKHAARHEAVASRSPTVLSPDSVGDETPNVVTRTSHDVSGQDASDETEPLTDPAVPPYLLHPDVPVHLLPMRESLVPIPGLYEVAPSLRNDSQGGRLSDRPHQDGAPR